LERILVNNPDLFSDTDEWRAAMLRAERAVCRVERPEGRAWGTGFLIGPGLLITNNHVREAGEFDIDPEGVRFRFGYRRMSIGIPGSSQTFSLRRAGPWLEHASPTGELDYCIVRTDSPAGRASIDDSDAGGLRGWIALDSHMVSVGLSLFILQHPYGDPIKMADGGLRKIDGHWVEYEVNTEHGSSGSPVLDNRWRLVALHSRAGTSANRGILASAILADLPDALREEIRRAGPPPAVREATGPAIASIEPGWGPVIDFSVLSIEELKLLTNAIIRLAPGIVRGETIEPGQVNLGGNRRLMMVPNPDAFMDGKMEVMGLDNQVKIVRNHQAAIDHYRLMRQAPMGAVLVYGPMILEQEEKLAEEGLRLCGRIAPFMKEVRLSR
jgi:hypothetical protein